MSLEERKKKDSKESSSEEKNKALNLVLGQIERNFGRGSIMRLGDASRMKVETISTGALTLDLALGGGYPCLLYTSPSPRDLSTSRMPSSA